MSEAKTVKVDSTENKIGLERFLKLVPQKSGIAKILRSKYAIEVHTQNEWNTIVESVLNRKVK